MEENRGEKRRNITKRRVGRNRETSGGGRVGGYKLWKGANATDAGYREGRGERGRNLSEWHQSAGLMRLAAITCISTT